MSTALRNFVGESNRIEGITRRPTEDELYHHRVFLQQPEITLADLEEFVEGVAGKPLRREAGMDVRVGGHFPPPGGPSIESDLQRILDDANEGLGTPYETHIEYETLHPFLDGNGRSGRVLWAWQMQQAHRDPFALPFLHRWYYDSLDAGHNEDDRVRRMAESLPADAAHALRAVDRHAKESASRPPDYL